MSETPDPVLALCDRVLADIQRLSAEVTRLVHEYGTLRRDTASKLADSTPPERRNGKPPAMQADCCTPEEGGCDDPRCVRAFLAYGRSES